MLFGSHGCCWLEANICVNPIFQISAMSALTVAIVHDVDPRKARDGVWRTTGPKPISSRSIAIPGAARVDVAVRCTADADLSVGAAGWGNNERTRVATIAVGSNINTDTNNSTNASTNISEPVAHPFASDGVSQWSAHRPSYLNDLRTVLQNDVRKSAIHTSVTGVNERSFNRFEPTLTASGAVLSASLCLSRCLVCGQAFAL
jgi:hypothetical protein